MSRSRSRSLPRVRSTHHRRSPSRSRSRSPAERRKRSRSRSRSPSTEAERRHKKHKKRSKRAKEEKKRHKKHKRKKDKEKEVETEGASTSEQPATSEQVNEKTTPVDARSFFQQLQKQEAAKEPVGTVHTRGLPAPVSTKAISTSDKWECSKAGCGNMNSKHAPACNKCGAMKRMTEWR